MYARSETRQLSFPIHNRAHLFVNHALLQTGNLVVDALGLERSVDDAQGDSRKPVPVGRFVYPLGLVWGEIYEFDHVGPYDGIVGKVEEICNLPPDSRDLFTQRSSCLRGTQCGLQVFDRLGQSQH